MFISFSWTTEAFLNDAKTMTRRYWKDSHALKFKKGMVVDAFDKLPYKAGKKIGEIKLTKDPYKQETSKMSRTDYRREGFLWMYVHNKRIKGQNIDDFFSDWVKKNDLVWVIEFEKIN